VNIWQSYKQERGCLMHFAHLANTLLEDEESARDNHVLACNFAKYSPIKNERLSFVRVEEGSLSTTQAFDCGHGYAQEECAAKRDRAHVKNRYTAVQSMCTPLKTVKT